MSGDDHSADYTPGGTASSFGRFEQLSPPGCVVAEWQCVRATSYVFPDSTLTNAQAEAFTADGFEVALHPVLEPCPTASLPAATLANMFDTQLNQFAQRYTSLPAPVTSRTHCVYWPDWATEPKLEAARGIRMDGNYYQYPGSWIGTKPGFMTGGGFPMRFADLNGSLIDVYQQDTNITDESSPPLPSMINSLLDKALGPRATTAPSASTSTPTSRRPTKATRRSSRPPRPAGCRSFPTSSCSTGRRGATSRRSVRWTGMPGL